MYLHLLLKSSATITQIMIRFSVAAAESETFYMFTLYYETIMILYFYDLREFSMRLPLMKTAEEKEPQMQLYSTSLNPLLYSINSSKVAGVKLITSAPAFKALSSSFKYPKTRFFLLL